MIGINKEVMEQIGLSLCHRDTARHKITGVNGWSQVHFRLFSLGARLVSVRPISILVSTSPIPS